MVVNKAEKDQFLCMMKASDYDAGRPGVPL